MKRVRFYYKWRDEKLKDPIISAQYLTAAAQEGMDSFLTALENIARVHLPQETSN